jgi:short-subunit dehydrogenase
MAFFDTLRAEHHQDGISVTLICPGFIRTQVSINAVTGDGSPLGEMDQAQDQGMSPEACAEGIFKALSQEKGRSVHWRQGNPGRIPQTLPCRDYFPASFDQQKLDNPRCQP